MLMPCEQCGQARAHARPAARGAAPLSLAHTERVCSHRGAQVVEVAALAEHLVTECDQSQPFKYQPPLGVTADYTGCPLCGEELPRDPDACRAHIMHECPGNKRRVPPP